MAPYTTSKQTGTLVPVGFESKRAEGAMLNAEATAAGGFYGSFSTFQSTVTAVLATYPNADYISDGSANTEPGREYTHLCWALEGNKTGAKVWALRKTSTGWKYPICVWVGEKAFHFRRDEALGLVQNPSDR